MVDAGARGRPVRPRDTRRRGGAVRDAPRCRRRRPRVRDAPRGLAARLESTQRRGRRRDGPVALDGLPDGPADRGAARRDPSGDAAGGGHPRERAGLARLRRQGPAVRPRRVHPLGRRRGLGVGAGRHRRPRHQRPRRPRRHRHVRLEAARRRFREPLFRAQVRRPRGPRHGLRAHAPHRVLGVRPRHQRRAPPGRAPGLQARRQAPRPHRGRPHHHPRPGRLRLRRAPLRAPRRPVSRTVSWPAADFVFCTDYCGSTLRPCRLRLQTRRVPYPKAQRCR
mmetsp:Transcript_15251/g.61310  ORF Transcript_15251/g.61310 Transcript_15251/m.61310 type:complete len:280 (+) Transcript_15251:780-1619(+)